MLRYVDSFQNWATGDILKRWTNWGGNGSISANGRFQTNAWGHSNLNDPIWKTIDSQATWVVGVAVRVNGVADFYPLRLYDGSTEHLSVKYNSTLSKFQILRGDGTVLGSGTYVYTPSTWIYLELKATISDSVGVAVLKINGSLTDINLSSVDTRNGGNASADTLVIMGNNNNGTQWYINDLYMLDTSGGSPTNDFLGDIKVEGRKPNGNGNSSQLVGSDGNSTDNYLLVDDSSPNDDTDYVESSTVGNKDTYTYEDLATTSGTVYGVQILPYAKKTDAGTRTICSVARLSGTEVDSADKTLASSYTYLPDIRETKPGGGAWSISDVNSAEFGAKVTA